GSGRLRGAEGRPLHNVRRDLENRRREGIFRRSMIFSLAPHLMPSLYRYVLLGACALLIALPAQAQRTAAQPASQRAADAQPLDQVARVAMAPVDNDALIARDEAR